MAADENLTNALNNINQAGGAAQQLSEMLQAASRSTSRNTTATDIARDSVREYDRATQSARNGMLSLVGTISSLAGSIISVSSSAYTADKAFTAMVPTLDAMGAALKGTFDALGKATSGASLFGFSFGRASEGVSEAAKLYVDVLQGALKFQLQAAQDTADRFIELSRAGATFSGGINELKDTLFGYVDETGKQINGLGLPLQEYTKIVTSNAEAISKLGKGMLEGGNFVAGMSKKIFYANEGLAMLYGSVTELSKGVADYAALQAQLGIDTTRNFNQSEAGATEFLLRQKELALVTGKNAETLRREEEGRRKQLDYNLKLGRLGEDARQNVQEGMAIAGKVFGDAGAKYAEEYFATGGKVFTREALAYQATNQEAVQAIEGMLEGVNQSRTAFRENATKTFQQAEPALKAYSESMEEYASINRAANNKIIGGMTDTATAIQQALPFIQNMGTLFKQLEADRKKLTEPLPTDEPMKAYVEANKAMLANRIEMDKIVFDGMSKMKDLVAALYEAQLGFIKSMPDTVEAFNKLKNGIGSATDAINEYYRSLATNMGFPGSTATTTPPPPGQPPAQTRPAVPAPNPVNTAPPAPTSTAPTATQPTAQTNTANTDTTAQNNQTQSPTNRTNQNSTDNPIVTALSQLPNRTDAERYNRDVLDALQKLTNAVA